MLNCFFKVIRKQNICTIHKPNICFRLIVEYIKSCCLTVKLFLHTYTAATYLQLANVHP